MKKTKKLARKRIHYGIRKKVRGTADRPRLSVYRSNTSIYCQLIDDIEGRTILSASSSDATVSKDVPRIDQANQVGKILAEKAISSNISTVVFDRSGFLYHGRIKALADGAREQGLKF